VLLDEILILSEGTEKLRNGKSIISIFHVFNAAAAAAAAAATAVAAAAAATTTVTT
jgi:hypothetical protein